MLAQIDFDKLNTAVGLDPKFKTVGDIVSALVPSLFVLAGFALLLYLVWGGFTLMTSGGDPKAIEGAKQKITHAVIGFVIVITAFWLVQLLGQILGIEQFGKIFGR